MDRRFFFNRDSGIETLFTTDSLSITIIDGDVTRTPIIPNLCSRACTFSLAILDAMSSDPNVAASTVVCRLENVKTTAPLILTMIPVQDLRSAIPRRLSSSNATWRLRESRLLGHVRTCQRSTRPHDNPCYHSLPSWISNLEHLPDTSARLLFGPMASALDFGLPCPTLRSPDCRPVRCGELRNRSIDQ